MVDYDNDIPEMLPDDTDDDKKEVPSQTGQTISSTATWYQSTKLYHISEETENPSGVEYYFF